MPSVETQNEIAAGEQRGIDVLRHGGEAKDGERSDDGSFTAEDRVAERGLGEAGGASSGKFVIGPAAFRADGQGGSSRTLIGCVQWRSPAESIESKANGRRVRALRKEDFALGSGRSREGLARRKRREKRGRTKATGLLRGFEHNFLPAIQALRSSGDQGFIRAGRGQRHDCGHAQLRGLFEAPFEAVEFHYGNQKCDLERGLMRGNGLEQGELNAAFAMLRESDALDAREPDAFAVAQFIKLAGFGAEDAAEMAGSVAAECGGFFGKTFDEEAPAHLRRRRRSLRTIETRVEF